MPPTTPNESTRSAARATRGAKAPRGTGTGTGAASTDYGALIEALGPLNNAWRAASGADKVLVLWDIGDALIAHMPKANDAVLWEVQARSYITRTVLRYALIVRREWTSRSALATLVTGVRSFAVFREALPFLKGTRQGIDDATYARVVAALRSDNAAQAITQLKTLKRDAIGRVHTKRSVKERAGTEPGALNTVMSTLIEAARRGEIAPVDGAAQEAVRSASQLALAMADAAPRDAARAASVPPPEDLDPHLHAVVAAIRELAGSSRVAQNAVRTAVGAGRFMDIAELLHALRSAAALTAWRSRQR